LNRPPVSRTAWPSSGRNLRYAAPVETTINAGGARLETRISREQKALFQRAAELQGRTLTDFVIASAHEAAVRVIEDMQTIRLSARDSRAFAEALINPREPNARRKSSAQRYLKLTGA
jgi:uncharacterized protein (DUF1778 family)